MIVQYSDTNVSPAVYNVLGREQLLVISVFYTIQGEGPYAGCPAIFIRLAGCNRGDKEKMGCAFCDTDFRLERGKVASFRDIATEMAVKQVDGRQSQGLPLAVITGGEPMIQNNISGFVKYLLTLGYRQIQIESNGDRLAKDFPVGKATIVVSPKVVGSRYLKPSQEAAEAATCFKFVISADEASPYHDVPDWALLHRDRVFLSPMTAYAREVRVSEVASMWDTSLADMNITRANYRRAAELAMFYGYRISLQSHLFLEVS